MSEIKGVIEHWNDQKGFGFITTPQGEKLFFHISVMRGDSRPQKGNEVFFQRGKDGQGRPVATHVRNVNLAIDKPSIRKKPITESKKALFSRTKNHSKKSGSREQGIPWLYLFLLLILPVVGVFDLAINYQVAWGILVYASVSLLTYFFYWDDKRRAQQNEWRIPEANLHLWALAGGWPGAFIAQQQFRHKTKKLSFQAMFWLIVAAHQLLWADWLFMDGKGLISLLGNVG